MDGDIKSSLLPTMTEADQLSQPPGNLVVIIGIEASGKTTLGRQLAKKLGCTYYPEIGQECRQKARCAVYDSCEAFDELVMMKELRRDKEVLNQSGRCVVLEQWHLGNLAFSRVRSGEFARGYLDFVATLLLDRLRPKVIFLELSVEKMLARKTQSKPPIDEDRLKAFYTEWIKQMENILAELGLEPLRLDAEQRPETLCDLAIQYLAKAGTKETDVSKRRNNLG